MFAAFCVWFAAGDVLRKLTLGSAYHRPEGPTA